MAVSVPSGSIGATGPMRAPEGLSHLWELLERAHPSWHERAACRSGEVDFFDERPDAITAARAVCASCPVVAQCRHYGRDERHGVWGGTSPASRALERRRADRPDGTIQRRATGGRR